MTERKMIKIKTGHKCGDGDCTIPETVDFPKQPTAQEIHQNGANLSDAFAAATKHYDERIAKNKDYLKRFDNLIETLTEESRYLAERGNVQKRLSMKKAFREVFDITIHEDVVKEFLQEDMKGAHWDVAIGAFIRIVYEDFDGTDPSSTERLFHSVQRNIITLTSWLANKTQTEYEAICAEHEKLEQPEMESVADRVALEMQLNSLRILACVLQDSLHLWSNAHQALHQAKANFIKGAN